MQKYNEQIVRQLKQNEIKMINRMPKIEKFQNQLKSLKQLQEPNIFHGGIRSLKYIEPGNTISSYEPETLAVEGSGINKRGRGRPRKVHGGSIWDSIGTVAKTVAPFAPLLLAAGIEKPKKRVRKPKHYEEIIQKEEIQYPITKRGRGRPKTTQGGNFFDDIKKVGRSVFPIAKEIGKELYPVVKEVALPIAKEALTSYMKGSGIKKPTKRNLMVKQLMLKHHMTLPEASKYIKEHNLA